MRIRRESYSLCSETASVPAKKSAESQFMSSRLKASDVRKLREGLLEESAAAAAVCSSAFSSLMFWSSVRISSDWCFFRKAICLWSLSFFAVKLIRDIFISCFCAVMAFFFFSNWRISLLTLLIFSEKMYKLQETPSQTQTSHLLQLFNTLHSLPPVRQWSHAHMASFLHLAIKSANQKWQKVDSFFFLISDEGMKKIKFLRTKNLEEEASVMPLTRQYLKSMCSRYTRSTAHSAHVAQRYEHSEQSHDSRSAHSAHSTQRHEHSEQSHDSRSAHNAHITQRDKHSEQ